MCMFVKYCIFIIQRPMLIWFDTYATARDKSKLNIRFENVTISQTAHRRLLIKYHYIWQLDKLLYYIYYIYIILSYMFVSA